MAVDDREGKVIPKIYKDDEIDRDDPLANTVRGAPWTSVSTALSYLARQCAG